jgi:alpha-galactosidase
MPLLHTTLLSLLPALLRLAGALDNGLATTPPMGWRSWEAYFNNISQAKMTAAADMMVRVDPASGVSLLQAGYTHIGLDDNWQACGAGVHGSFHNASGYPLINTGTFPNLKAMTAHAKSLGLTPGWYMNNCDCKERPASRHMAPVPEWGPGKTPADYPYLPKHYAGDVQATVDFGFESMKLDGCGYFTNLTTWANLYNATGVPMLIENCHWGGDGPGR